MVKMKSKKTIINFLIFISLILITYFIIFKDINPIKIYKQISSLNIIYLLISIFLMVLFFTIESFNVKNILNALGEKITLRKTLKYTLIGFFFSSITPASTGGEPMEIYYMSKDNIKISNSTIALLIYLCGHHLNSIIIGLISLIINPKLLSKELLIVFIIGNILNTIPVIITFIAIFNQKLFTKIVNFIINLIRKIKRKNSKDLIDKINTELVNYQKGASFIRNNKKEFIKSICTSFCHVITYYMVPYFIYKSFNLNNYSIIKFISLQAILHSTVCSIPLPGTVGASESVFLILYQVVYSKELIDSALITNRFITFYLFVLISLIIFLIHKFSLKNKKTS